MSRRTVRRRSGVITGDLLQDPVADIAALRLLAARDVNDGQLVLVRDLNRLYAFRYGDETEDDDSFVIAPDYDTTVGRWRRVGFSGGGSGDFADKWIDVTKVMSTETVTVDGSASADVPQEIRRQEIDVEGVLDVIDGYVIVGFQNLAETLQTFNKTQGSDIELTSGDHVVMGQAGPPSTAVEKGVYFVGDGTGGTVAGEPYFRAPGDGALSQLNAPDHGTLPGTGDDDHTQYAILVGRGGGQTLQGGSAASEDLSLESTSHATKGRVKVRDPLAMSESAEPATALGESAVFASDGTGGHTQGEVYIRRPSNGEMTNISRNWVPYHLNIPEDPSNTVEYRGWAYAPCRCVKVRAYMATNNTVGTYVLTVTNNATGNTMLSAATFDMNTLVSDTVTAMTLTGTGSDLAFADGDRWTVDLTSNDAGFNGVGIYVELVFEAA